MKKTTDGGKQSDLTKNADLEEYEQQGRLESQLVTSEFNPSTSSPASSCLETVFEATGKPDASQIIILVADDNTVDRKVASSMLHKLGCHADFVSNGRDAIRIMEKKHYDMVLMDCVMPIMDGFEAAAIIRNPESAVLDHQVPVIAMTAGFVIGDEAKYLNAGMNDYIAKPISLPKLAAIVTKLAVFRADMVQKNQTLIFDRQELAERLLYDEGLLLDVINDFLQNLPMQIEKLKNSANTPILAHIIKDSAMAIGANELYPIAMKIENAAKNSDDATATKLLPQLEAAAARLVLLLENEVKNK